MLTLEEMTGYAREKSADLDDGGALSALEESLIKLGVAVSVTSLDAAAIDRAICDSLDAGASPQQVQEVVSLISGLGVHSLMVSAARIVSFAEARGLAPSPILSAHQRQLWDQYVGDDPFWKSFEAEMPGFLAAMLRLSPDQFEAFFTYCAVPWNSGQVRARLKELIAMASDATPTHRFQPGFRVHLANAIKLGAGRLAIERTLELAAAAPLHVGTR